MVVWIVQASISAELYWVFDVPISLVVIVFPVNGISLLWIERRFTQGSETRIHWIAYSIVSVIGLFVSAVFYQDVMHDLGLTFFDSHGRFGCIAVDSGYCLTSDTLPWLTFASGPFVVAICMAIKRIRITKASSEHREQVDPR